MKGKSEGSSTCGEERLLKIPGILCATLSYDLSVVDTVTKHLVRDNFVVLGGLELIND